MSKKVKRTDVPCLQPGVDPDDWFRWLGSPKTKQAKAACNNCPLLLECRAYAIEEGIPDGVWGAFDASDREKYWQSHGGKPTGFIEVIESQVRPLLQERRDAERDRDDQESAFAFRQDPYAA